MKPARRNLLGGIAALAAAPVPALADTPARPDAVLLAACATYLEKEAAYNDAFRQQCSADEAGDKAEERRLDLLQRALAQEQQKPLEVIIETMAVTQAGKLAKTAVAMTLVQAGLDGVPLSPMDAMLWSICEDVAGKPLAPSA